MIGMRFDGYPDLGWVLLDEEFEGHPRHTDNPINRRPPLIEPNG